MGITPRPARGHSEALPAVLRCGSLANGVPQRQAFPLLTVGRVRKVTIGHNPVGALRLALVLTRGAPLPSAFGLTPRDTGNVRWWGVALGGVDAVEDRRGRV